MSETQMTMEDNPLRYENTGVLLRRFAVPSIVAMLVSSLYNIVDQIFIGQGVGYLGNAATNVAFPFVSICLAIGLLIGIGSAATYSLELGRGNKKKAEQSVGNAIWLITILGMLLLVVVLLFKEQMLTAFGATKTVMPYALDYVGITAVGMPFLIFMNGFSALIRADGSPKYSMMVMVVGAVINTILDPIMIFNLDMGVRGAALATTISQVISAVLAFIYIFRFKQVKLSRKSFVFNISECLTQISLGLSNSLNQVAICLVQIVMNNSLTYYGQQSIYGADIPLSACGIVMKVNGIMISIFVGMAQGAQPITGFNYGAKQFDRVKQVYYKAITTSFILACVGFACFQLIPHQIVSLFGTGEPLYFQFAEKFMRTFLFMMPLVGIQIISSNFFSAIGKPVKGVVLSLSRSVLFIIPLMLILPLFGGIEMILFAGPIADLLAFLIAVVLIFVEFKKMKPHKE